MYPCCMIIPSEHAPLHVKLLFFMQVIKTTGLKGAVADIAISGLPAWITLLSPGRHGSIRVRVWAPRGVEVFVRPSIPTAGLSAYEPDPLLSDADHL